MILNWLDEDAPPHVCHHCGKRGDVQIPLEWNGLIICLCYDHAVELRQVLAEEV